MSTNIIYYILHKILFIGLRAPISLLDVKDTGRENVHRFGSRWFSELRTCFYYKFVVTGLTSCCCI